MEIIQEIDTHITVAKLNLPGDREMLEAIHSAYDREYGFSRTEQERDMFATYLSQHADIYHTIVLLLDNRLAGYIRAYDRLSTSSCDIVLMLDLVYILPEYRGKGLGRFLMNAFLSFAQVNRKARIDLLTDLDNPAAVKLYESLGFKGRSRHQMIFFVKDQPELAIYLEKKLKQKLDQDAQ